MEWYLAVLKQYAVFQGRAGRREFWMFTLVNALIVFALSFVAERLGIWALVIVILYLLATAIPSLAVTVRRLHDVNRTGWWFLINLVPVLGTIVLLIILAQQSQPVANSYGASPIQATA
jgi:uncharacterized membrane protein YhaH (DUF805 family)